MAAGVKTVRAQGSYIMDKIDLLTGYLIWNPLSELLGKVMGAQAQSRAEKVSAANCDCGSHSSE